MVTRVVIALGGNAISPAGEAGTAREQTSNIDRTMRAVAGLVEEGLQVVLTHGNGPQVGNVLIKNEMARDVVPPVPLDWCVAQTQATIGFTAASALSFELARRGADRPVVPVVSRVLVDGDDPAFGDPTKPIGPYLDGDVARQRERETGDRYVRQGDRGWRRVVASPTPLRSIDRPAVELLLEDGAVVIANGGGGIPVVERAGEPLRGVEAVIDKDHAGALLAAELDAEVFAILTDVPGVAVGWGTPEQRWLDEVTPDELREHAAAGEFAAGSMGPKVEAACAVADRGGRAAIAALDDVVGAVHGTSGTQVRA